jgi:hypothetical protein
MTRREMLRLLFAGMVLAALFAGALEYLSVRGPR